MGDWPTVQPSDGLSVPTNQPLTNHEPATLPITPIRHCDACPGQHAGGTPTMRTRGLRPGQYLVGRHEYPVADQPARVS